MNTYQNIFNMLTISLCILMTGTICWLVQVNKDLQQQIFEVDNIQGREHTYVSTMETLGKADEIFVSEISKLKVRDESFLERVNSQHMHLFELYTSIHRFHPEFKVVGPDLTIVSKEEE